MKNRSTGIEGVLESRSKMLVAMIVAVLAAGSIFVGTETEPVTEPSDTVEEVR